MAEFSTTTLGIHQSDIIIRSAIVQAIADIRANPWLLDYVFCSLKYDSLTEKSYGNKEIEAAKKWFNSNDIAVVMSTKMDDAKIPCISIVLQESVEVENTLGDVHYDTAEDDDTSWPVVISKFTPESYNITTGTMTLDPDAVTTPICPGMMVVCKNGDSHVIESCLNYYTFILSAGLVADFTDCSIRSARPAKAVRLESAVFKESYHIGCHCLGEPVYLTYLHSILVFALLRYRETLLEARGFERSVIASSDHRKNELFDPQSVYQRFLTITGFVRQYWPKLKFDKPSGVIVVVGPDSIEDFDGITTTMVEDALPDIEDRDALDVF